MLSPDSVTIKKQRGEILSQPEIEYIVNGYTAGTINDDDMTSWLKAVLEHGMNYKETKDYTQIMLNSGVRLDFSYLPGYVIDKHSTGGVGDKVSLILGPLLSSCGCYVPMLAGRGLGHTQGTIDKLDTIPGYQSSLSLSEFQRIVENEGISVMAQTADICPADQKIYALRDVTDTIDSFSLICGSIMSKKISEGIQGLILDIKVGNGAFMKTLSKAKKLGALLKSVGKLYGLQQSICYTGMDQPLGNTAGLWCEVMESMECLNGNGPDDVMSVVYYLGEEALKLTGIPNPRERLIEAINDGSAIDKFRKMVYAHGGSLDSLNDIYTHKPKYREIVYAGTDGYITEMNTLSLGKVIVHLGGGYLHKEDILDPTVGIAFHKKIGDAVHEGEPLLEYFCSDKDKFESTKLYYNEPIKIEYELAQPIELIYR